MMKERLLRFLEGRYCSHSELIEMADFVRSHRFIPLVKKLRVEIGPDETLPK